MTDKAFTESSSQFGAALLARGRGSQSARAGETVVSLPGRSAEQASTGGEERFSPNRSAEWSSALRLVQEASEAIRISEERAGDLEAQLEDVMAQAAAEVRRLNAELSASEQRAARSEERARASETRASDAEAWLTRLNQAIESAFAPLQRRSPSAPASHAHEPSSD